MLIEPLKLTGPVAAFNGGVFVKPDLRTVLAQRTIPPAVARQTVDHLLRRGPRRLGLPGRRVVPPPGGRLSRRRASAATSGSIRS